MVIVFIGLFAVIGLVLILFTWLAGPDPDLRERPPMARPDAIPGCFGCALAASASDYHLSRHLVERHSA